MKPIEVMKEDLLVTMKQNRAKHAQESDEATINWRTRISAEMCEAADAISIGDDAPLFFDAPPKSFLSAYDTAIDMLEWDKGVTVELSREDFNRFVRDEWEWTEGFKQSYASNDINALKRR